MKKTILLALTITMIALVLGSCATTFSATNGKLSYGSMSGTNKGTFTAKANAISILSPYILPITKPYAELDKLIEPELSKLGANAATNVEIKYGFDFLGFIITGATGGVLSWNYVAVEGQAIAQ